MNPNLIKKIFWIASFIFIFSLAACNKTREQKVKQLVNDYLQKTLNDPHSYESVEFSKIDSNYSILTDDPDYNRAKAKKDSIEVQFTLWKSKNPDFDGYSDLSPQRVKYFLKMNKYFSDAMLAEGKKAIEIERSFKPKYNGLAVVHTYRAKNGFGALGLHQTMFVLDTNLTKVIDVLKIDN
ncbi:hypothetical protein SAMN05192574_109107 [Mucilaginibacter gossypiicola]|uniref:Lipoprotein n=1 Tax=Mucilaginibacter gossypiicola TaxID=551995 RepID=A0A1H8QRB7_9SPHI|nr:hypothetical protein [Mucilaginibacter gossypiicola]SEO56527.1 hypothetical protein SAMN05192574_109107 [Mucilaginibacter gossypiicola]